MHFSSNRGVANSKSRILIFSIALIGIAVLASSLKNGASLIPVAAAAGPGNYTTQFPATENPISEGGKWINGGVTGGQALWGNIRSGSNMAFGANEPTQYGDPTAIVAGTWGATQTVTGVVKVNSVPSSCCHEVELRLRTSISANSITGYEVLCPVHASPGYGIQIVRWNGPNGQYVYINTGSAHQCVNGDVMMAKATGSNPTTVSVYINGSLKLTGVDHGTETGPGGAAGPFTGGSPGIGFYDSSDNNWSAFGFSSFTATDGTSGIAPPSNLTVTVQ